MVNYISDKAILSFSIGSIFLASFYLFNIGVTISEDNRISLFGDNENFVGVKMSISIILILFIVFQNNLKLNKLRFILLIPIPIMFKLLIETGSRVSIISLLLMVLLSIYYIKINKLYIKLTLLIFVFILTFIAFQFILQNQLLLLRLFSSLENKDIGGRDVIFLEIWNQVRYYPILGIGQTGYYEFFGTGSPHNVLLEVFSYTGIIGLILYLYFLYDIYIISRRVLITKNIILPFLLIIPITGLLLSGQLLTLKLCWIIFAYIVYNEKYLVSTKPQSIN
jgi:O-antigen ligase